MIEMVMIVQLTLLLRVSACVGIAVSVLFLIPGEDSSTTADVTTGGKHKRSYPHHHHNNQLRTISTM